MASGKLIVIDGGDGAGKKTQASLLIQHLFADGKDAILIDFPQYENNTFGKLLKECLVGLHGDFLSIDPKIASTLYAADRFESKGRMEKWLSEGKVVIVDRYVSSNMLHQGGKIDDPKEREEFLAWLDHMEHGVFGLPRPDLIIYCSVDPEKRMELLQSEAQTTGIATDQPENDLAHQQRTDVAAKQVVAQMNNWQTIECMERGQMRSPEDISEDIYTAVKNVL